MSLASDDEAARRLMTIPGIATVNATALALAVGNARTFGRSRDMALWLSPTPRQATTGSKPQLLGISKRENRHLRKNLIHGAEGGDGAARWTGEPARPVGWRAFGTLPGGKCSRHPVVHKMTGPCLTP
jgi:transposase